jgi:TonB family protein
MARMNRFLGYSLLLSAVVAHALHAQEAVQVSAKDIQQHIDHKAFPTYPLAAKAARVEGSVVLDLRIGTKGKIETLKVVSGPALLQQAATDCLEKWTFRPFTKDGAPVAAEGQYTIIFSLGSGVPAAGHPSDLPTSGQAGQSTPTQTVTVKVRSQTEVQGVDPKLEEQFNTSDDACKDGILSHKFDVATVSSCRQAAELADQFPAEHNFVTKRSAFVYAATAYADVGDFQKALPWANKAVAVVDLGQDSNSGSEAAYSTRGEVEAFDGDLQAADRDLSKGEQFERKALDALGSDRGSSPNTARTLIRDPRFHAQVLQKLNRNDEAKERLDEASKYE